MKYLWIILIAGAALGIWLYLNRGKCKLCKLFQNPVKQEEETPPLDPTGAGFGMGGGGAAGFQPGDISGMMSGLITPPTLIVQPKLTYQQVVQRRLGEPVKKIGNIVFKPLPGSNIVKTPSGGTATIGANPNQPRFT